MSAGDRKPETWSQTTRNCASLYRMQTRRGLIFVRARPGALLLGLERPFSGLFLLSDDALLGDVTDCKSSVLMYYDYDTQKGLLQFCNFFFFFQSSFSYFFLVMSQYVLLLCKNRAIICNVLHDTCHLFLHTFFCLGTRWSDNMLTNKFQYILACR